MSKPSPSVRDATSLVGSRPPRSYAVLQRLLPTPPFSGRTA
ncbi:MAG: hypothetical protein ACKOVB_02615 [Terrabacter sp.]